jgi:ribosomal protein S4E
MSPKPAARGSRAMDESAGIRDGDHCLAVAGTHAGKSGIVEDAKLSATGHRTITVRQADGVRFKTLARNVRRSD